MVYPDLASIHTAFPNVEESKLGHDLAYSAMLTKLPSGLLGLVLASLGAAYMSTISTHLNWGSSYIVNDFYKQQINKNASERELVNIGRISTVILMVFSAILALFLTNAMQLFSIILMFGAGTGLIFILRWFWWRINAWSEIAAMFSSGIVSILFLVFDAELFSGPEAILPSWSTFPLVVLITTIIWLLVTYLTPPEENGVLYSFYKQTQPGGPGWKRIITEAQRDDVLIVDKKEKWTVPAGILAMVLGCLLVYGCLFATGNWIYGNYTLAIALTVMVAICAFLLIRVWNSMKSDIL